LDDEHLVTCGHVVRPYTSARVIFADGTEIAEAPVVGWDLIGDIAVLRARVPSSASPARRSGPALETGSRVYLVGYPLAGPVSPETSISESVIARSPITWSETGLTFLRTDAAIENGQSGGVLAGSDGSILGLTCTSSGRFANAVAISDVESRVGDLLAGRDVDGLEDRIIPEPARDAPRTAEVDLAHRADASMWVMDAKQDDPKGTVTMTADRPTHLRVHAGAGKLATGTGGPVTEADLEVEFGAPAPYLLIVSADEPAHVELTSTVGITPFADPDDGATIEVGGRYVGVADKFGDLDWLNLELEKGQAVVITASSVAFDPALFVDLPGDEGPPIGGSPDVAGPVGWDDELRLRAPASGTYHVIVNDQRDIGAGAYFLIVRAG
jgi:hypothetical protein